MENINKTLLSYCPNMILQFDENLKLQAYNKPYKKLLKQTNEDNLTNLPLNEIFSAQVEAAWIKRLNDANLKTLNNKEIQNFDDSIKIDDEIIMHVQIAIHPILNDDKECVGTVITLSDITELIESNQKAEAAAQSKSNFLANMSHEIRTPMNAVKGLSELLSLTELNGLQRNYVDNIINSANSLLSIINDVLDFSKIDANKTELIKGPFSLSDMISNVANMVSMRAEDKDIEMILDIDPNLPKSINGDDVRIKQIFTNLLSNAVKYTNEGSVKLSIRLEQNNKTDWLKCQVADTGVGIKEEDMDSLFDSFARADLKKNRDISGAGLGLAISKRLVDAMGGNIWVESEYGKGSTFGFVIPVSIIDKSPIAKVSSPEKIKLMTVVSEANKTILENMLYDLNVSYTEYSDSTSDEEIKNFTHCIIDESIQLGTFTKITKLNSCPIATIKDMRNAMDLKGDKSTILYLPLFIVDVAKFINDSTETSLNTNNSNAGSVKVENVKALIVDDNDINLVVSGEMLSAFNATVHTAESGKRHWTLQIKMSTT